MTGLIRPIWYAYLKVWRRPTIGPIIGALTPDRLGQAMSNASRHREVRVAHGDQEAMVDAGIAPLIHLLWTHGIVTNTSCENHEGRVLVEFVSADDMLLFIDIVGSASETLHNHITGDDEPDDWRRFRHSVMWKFDISYPFLDTDGTYFVPWYTVRFPRVDLPTVMRALEGEPT